MNTLARDSVQRSPRVLGAVALIAVGLTACSSLGVSNKTQGAVIGATAGGVAGGVIGNQVGSTAIGAIVGAAVGGTAGAVIGHQMDQQSRELQQDIPGATVTRVGEGIAVSFASGLLFDLNSDAVRDEAARNLRSLASSLGRYPNTDLLIVGHTDAQGTDSYNQDLSMRRARSIAGYLATQGVASARLNTVGRGETEPIATNDTDEGRQANRRVEVAIYANAAARQQ